VSRAILLFAHGARDPAWALPFRAIRDAVAAAAPGVAVELAFLELMTPALPDCAAALIAQGIRAITVVPLFMAQGGHLKRDLPELLDALRQRHADLSITLTPAIGDVPALTGAIARWVTSVALPDRDRSPGARPPDDAVGPGGTVGVGWAAADSVDGAHERQDDGTALLRQSLLREARRLNSCGLNQGTSGNLSVRLPDGLLITPSGMPCDALEAGDLVKLDFDGRFCHALAPSSEWQMHRDIYRQRPDARAVVHAHPPHCTALAIRHMEIPPLHYMIAVSGGASIRCAPYHTYGTAALSQAALVALEGRNCCLLANHGMLAVGPSLARAMWVAEETEALARQYLLTLQMGGPTLLPEDEIARVVEKFRHYGPQSAAPDD
jgi:L-fuculose-phosphate aldolase